MAIISKLKNLFGHKSKGYVKNNNFEQLKNELIREFEKIEDDYFFNESFEKIDGDGMQQKGYYTFTYKNNNQMVVCDKLYTANNVVADGYPAYKILTKNPDNSYDFKTVSFLEEINYSTMNVENAINVEYNDNFGYKTQIAYKSDFESGNSEKFNVIQNCLDIINKAKTEINNNRDSLERDK